MWLLAVPVAVHAQTIVTPGRPGGRGGITQPTPQDWIAYERELQQLWDGSLTIPRPTTNEFWEGLSIIRRQETLGPLPIFVETGGIVAAPLSTDLTTTEHWVSWPGYSLFDTPNLGKSFLVEFAGSALWLSQADVWLADDGECADGCEYVEIPVEFREIADATDIGTILQTEILAGPSLSLYRFEVYQLDAGEPIPPANAPAEGWFLRELRNNAGMKTHWDHFALTGAFDLDAVGIPGARVYVRAKNSMPWQSAKQFYIAAEAADAVVYTFNQRIKQSIE